MVHDHCIIPLHPNNKPHKFDGIFFLISPLGRGIRMWSSWGFATAPGFQIIMSNFNHERWMITVVCIARARICTEEGGRL